MAPQVVTCCQPAAVTVLGALAFLCRGVCVPAVGALPFCPTPTGMITPPPPCKHTSMKQSHLASRATMCIFFIEAVVVLCLLLPGCGYSDASGLVAWKRPHACKPAAHRSTFAVQPDMSMA